MRSRLPHIFLMLAATAGVLAAPAARAFTVENKDADGQYSVPKFDLEEQSKNFRKGDASTAGKSDFSTPFGSGTLHFGVTQGSAANFGSVFSPQLGPSGTTQSSRNEFDRRLAPPSSLEYNNPR